MQASVKLGLAVAAAALVGFAYAQDKSGRVKIKLPNLPDQSQGEAQAVANPGSGPAGATEGGVTSFTRKVIGAAGSEEAPPASRPNDRLRNAGPVNGAATMPDVAKTPTPSGPVPIPYPNTAARPTPVPLPQPIVRPAPTPVPAVPAKIDAITIKQR
jgi:hypothetical protein